MGLFIVNGNGENHYVNACNQERALWLIKKRLMDKYGRYNITDIKRVAKIKKDVSTLNNNIVTTGRS